MEQTINREAKNSGGIKSFGANSASILKMCLNRCEQAKNTKTLSDMCGINTDAEMYKPCRPSQIIRSNKMVNDIIQVFTNQFSNSFSKDVGENKLLMSVLACP